MYRFAMQGLTTPGVRTIMYVFHEDAQLLGSSAYVQKLMRFSWNEEKNQRNTRKHGVSFELASEVFEDSNAISLQDDSCDTEERWLTTGMARGIIVLSLVHTWEEENHEEVVRIISARKATRLEREEYENQYKKP